jgi:hypothetical protein
MTALEQSSASTRRMPASLPIIAIICLGAFLRVLWRLTHPVTNSADAIVYLREAGNLFSNGVIESNVYMPFYPILIHLAGPDGIMALQIVLSSASLYLGYRIASDLWSTTSAGLITAGLMAAHPVLIYYDSSASILPAASP